MTHWFEVFKYEIRLQFRRKAYRFMTFVVPALAVVAFLGYQTYQDSQSGDNSISVTQNPLTQQTNSSQESTKNVGLVDQTPQHLFPAPDTYAEPEGGCQATAANSSVPISILLKRISSPYCQGTNIHYFDSIDAGKAALKDKTIDTLFVVEPDYIQTGEVSAYMEGINIENLSTDSQLTEYLLASMLYNVDAKQYESLYLRLRSPLSLTEHKIAETGATETSNKQENVLIVYVFGLGMMLSLFWGGGYVMQSVVQEKESRIIEIILSSVRPTPLLFGKILAMGVLSLLQIGMLIGAFLFIASRIGNVFEAFGNIQVGAGTLILAGVYFVLGFLLFGSLMAAIGAVSSSVRESQNFVTVITLPAAIPFFFLALFIDNPNGALPTILSMVPITAPLSMVMRLSVASVPAVQIALSMALLVLGVGVAIWLAGRLFRVNTLLMGNTPKLRDIPKLIRG